MQSNRIIKQIRLLFWTIFVLLLTMFFIVFFLVHALKTNIGWNPEQQELLKSVILILSLGGIPASYIFHSKKVNHIPREINITDKLKQFRSSFFVKVTTLEALGFLAILSYLLTADKTFIYVFALLFVAFFINVPSRKSILNELEPDETNQEPEL